MMSMYDEACLANQTKDALDKKELELKNDKKSFSKTFSNLKRTWTKKLEESSLVEPMYHEGIKLQRCFVVKDTNINIWVIRSGVEIQLGSNLPNYSLSELKKIQSKVSKNEWDRLSQIFM